MADQDLLDYVDEEIPTEETKATTSSKCQAEEKRGSHVCIHASGFKDFLLKPELNRAILDFGFEHPSQVQYECIPQAVLSMDVVCQAKSGMGKTAVFVLSTLQQMEERFINSKVLN